MNIFSDVHTYLIISFALMLFLLFKYTYKQLMSGLDKKVACIKEAIEAVEKRKKTAEEELSRLKKEIVESNELFERSIAIAEEDAKKILSESGEIINNIVTQKEKECKESIEKIKTNMSIELQNKIVDIVISNIVAKLNEAYADREIQNINIDNSTKMLEELVEKYVNSKKRKEE